MGLGSRVRVFHCREGMSQSDKMVPLSAQGAPDVFQLQFDMPFKVFIQGVILIRVYESS